MLPSKLRISKAEFKSFGQGINYQSQSIFLTVHKKQDQTASQISFICSKKVAKSAVKRNLLRRCGYNIMQKLIKNIKPGFYLVFSFKKGDITASHNDIKNEIHSLLQRAEVISST